MTGLSNINIELTSRCNKVPGCPMCGRRKLERMKQTDWGDIPFGLLSDIARQIPPGVVVQLHNNGEPMLYHLLREAVGLFKHNIVSFNTNGILLVERAKEIIGLLDTLVVSVVENDELADQQYENVLKFMELKKDAKPLVVFRLLGDVRRDLVERYKTMGIIATRILHDPMGSRNYEKKVTVPEIGVCLDLLHHMAIDRHGKVSLCVRFDPAGLGVIGDANVERLEDIWNGPKRKDVIWRHLQGQRSLVPLCSTCDYWGVPIGR